MCPVGCQGGEWLMQEGLIMLLQSLFSFSSFSPEEGSLASVCLHLLVQ